MQAYEFFATPENGYIQIPEQFRNRLNTRMKVILLEENMGTKDGDESNMGAKSDLLIPPTLDTKGWTFSREEANER